MRLLFIIFQILAFASMSPSALAQSSSAALAKEVPPAVTNPEVTAPAASSTETPKSAPVYDSSQTYNRDYQKVDKVLGNKEFQDDHKLTDLRLRAQDGSLSRYSINTSMNLDGPSVGNPNSPDRPNPDGKIGNYAQKFQGNVAARYRLDSDHTLGFGTGISFNHPLQGVDRTDVSTPFVSYVVANRLNGVQMLVSPNVSYASTPENQAHGQFANAGIGASFVKDLGRSRFSASFDTRASSTMYSRGYVAAPQSTSPTVGSPHNPHSHSGMGSVSGVGDGNAAQYNLGAGPGLKYHLTDRMDMSANLVIPFYNPMVAENASVLLPNSPTMYLGFGWAYDRDIYVGPSLAMFPTILSPDTTTVQVSLIFSVL